MRFFGIALVARYYGDQAWTFMRQNKLLAGVVAAVLLASFYWFSRRVR